MSSSIPQIKLVFDRKKNSSDDKEGIIEIRISYDYKKKYISTGIKVFPHQWKKDIVCNHPDASSLNRIIDKKVIEVRKAILDMIDEENMDILSIPDRIKKINEPKKTFFDFCAQRAEVRKYGKSMDNQKRYDRFLRFFKA